MKQLLFFLLCLPFFAKAQALKVGDKMPDWTFSPIVNGRADIHLNQYKGKVVLLSFWASTCGGCLNALTKAAEFEKEFGGELKLVFATDDRDGKKPVALMNKRPDLKNLGIPLMKRDTALLKLFPHTGDPHEVLIGKDGYVKAITGIPYITKKVIENLIAGKEINLPVQKPTLSYDNQNSLLKDGFLTPENLLYNSVLTKYNDDLRTGLHAQGLPGGKFRLGINNVSIFDLYAFAYQNRLHFTPSDRAKRIIVNAKDRKRFGLGITDPLVTDYKYCYELIVPDLRIRSSYGFSLDYMKQDMDRYFNTTATVEKRRVKGYLLKAVDTTGYFVKDTTADVYDQHWPGKTILQNAKLSSIAGLLNKNVEKEMIFCDDQPTKRFTMEVMDKYESIEQAKIQLMGKGFYLIPTEKEIEFLVITENDSLHQNH